MDPNKLKIAVICPRGSLFPYVVRRLRQEGKMYVAQLKFETPSTIYFMVHRWERVRGIHFHGLMLGPRWYEVKDYDTIVNFIVTNLIPLEESADATVERLSKTGYQLCPPEEE